MSEEKLLFLTPHESNDTILAKAQLLSSLRSPEYRREFVAERVRSSMALQIRALREQRKMSQAILGNAIGMAQTWVSKLENPDYGKMTVATLLRVANAFDTDLEIKFRPFSTTINALPRQREDYFDVPGFDDEFGEEELSVDEQLKATQKSMEHYGRQLAPGAREAANPSPRKDMSTASSLSSRGGLSEFGGSVWDKRASCD
jgi:transcriptional regulator with XRE-family HTH domain